MSIRNLPRGGQRRDAKTMSMNRFVRLDPDLASSYDDVEEDPPTASSYQRDRMQQQSFRGGPRGGPRGRPGGGGNYSRGGRRPDRYEVNAIVSHGGRDSNKVMINEVTIPRAESRKYDIPKLMRSLAAQVEVFKPINLQKTPQGNVIFYVKDDESADAIRTLSRRLIDDGTGDRVTLLARSVVAPWTKISATEVELINKAIDSRFKPETNALDLSEFVTSKEFQAAGLNLTMTRNNVMLAIMDRIDEKYGGIAALSFKGNRLKYLDYASQIVHITKGIKILDLSHNQIEKQEELAKLHGLPVETLFLESNPIVDAYPVMKDYLSVVHGVFPRVAHLDGMNVTPQLSAPDLEAEAAAKLPPFKPGYYGNDTVRGLVETFVVDYFKVYDADDVADRRQLMMAYHDKATFTLICDSLPDSPATARYPNDESYHAYRRVSHNVMIQDRWTRHRENIIFKGSMDIAVALSRLPLTNHYKDTFIVDVSLISDSLLVFSVQGLYEDGERAKPPIPPILNSFVRTFAVVPMEAGKVAVVNDELFVSAITKERMIRYRNQLQKALNTAVQDPNAASVAPAPVSAVMNQLTVSTAPSDDIKQQMIEQFSVQSGMKPEWSRRCLEDNEWNYERAGQAFLDNKPNIPAEAFA